MTKDKQRKNAIRAEARARGVSYQTVVNDHAATATDLLDLPKQPVTGFSIAASASGPLSFPGNLWVRSPQADVDADSSSDGVSAALASLVLYAAISSLDLPLDERPQFLIVDHNATLVETADALDRHGMLISYVFDEHTHDEATAYLQREYTERRERLSAAGIKAMMTTTVDARPTIVVTNDPERSPLNLFEDRNWWRSPLKVQFTAWTVSDPVMMGLPPALCIDASDNPRHARLADGEPVRLLDPAQLAQQLAERADTEQAPAAGTFVRFDDVAASERRRPEKVPVSYAAALGIQGQVGALTIEARWAQSDTTISLPLGFARSGDNHAVSGDVERLTLFGTGMETSTHILIQGVSGSGKSSTLDSWVTALASSYSPDLVNMILVSRGVSAARKARFGDLPHVTDVVQVNSADTYIRFACALAAEHDRRRLLLNSGRGTTLAEYRAQPHEEPMPELVVMVDDAHLLDRTRWESPRSHQIFHDVLRTGRAVGIHLIVAEQICDQHEMSAQLWDAFDTRISFQSSNARSSMAMIGLPSAEFFSLGEAAVGRRTSSLFRSFAAAEDFETASDSIIAAVCATDAAPAAALVSAGLHCSPMLTELPPSTLPDFTVGLIDGAAPHQQEPLKVSTGGNNRHLCVVGPRGSGRTTVLSALVIAAARARNAGEAAFYLIDLSDTAGLSALSALPNVGAVAGPTDSELIDRIWGEALRILAQRSGMMASGIYDTLDSYLACEHRAHAGDPYGHFYLVIDNARLHRSESYYGDLIELLERGGPLGIHVILSSTSPEQVPGMDAEVIVLPGVNRYDLDDRLVGEATRMMPSDPGYTVTKQHGDFVTARFAVLSTTPDGDANGPGSTKFAHDAQTLAANLADSEASGGRAPRLQTVSRPLELSELPVRPAAGSFVLGQDRRTLDPVINPSRHLIVTGKHRSGRTNLVRLVMAQIVKTYTPEEAAVYVVDHSLGLASEVDSLRDRGYLGERGYAYDLATTRALIDRVAALGAERQPTPTATSSQLRDGTFWSGKRVFVLVDECSMLTGGDKLFSAIALNLSLVDTGIDLVLTILDQDYETWFSANRGILSQALANAGTPVIGLSSNRRDFDVAGVDVEFGARPDGAAVMVTPVDAPHTRIIQVPLVAPLAT